MKKYIVTSLLLTYVCCYGVALIGIKRDKLMNKKIFSECTVWYFSHFLILGAILLLADF